MYGITQEFEEYCGLQEYLEEIWQLEYLDSESEHF